MWDSYTYRKSVHKHRYAKFRRRLWQTVAILALLAVIAGAIFYDLGHGDQSKPAVSAANDRAVADTLNTIRSNYFQFSDTGKWALSNADSAANKFVYYKYRGLVLEHQLSIYLNQEPIPLNLATSRALPVRIVNGNSFDVTQVAGPCGGLYGAKEPHKIKPVVIQGATMLCDPDTPQYTVVLAEINGDYRLHLKRQDGSPEQLVIIYHDLTLDPKTDSLIHVADSFQSL